MANQVGRTLGRYELTAFLGAGGMGEVYRARDTSLGREVAVKILPEEVSEDPGRLERFKKEARSVARLSHPNILAIHDFGHENGTTFAVMELLEGRSLRQRLRRGRVAVKEAVGIAGQVAKGLAAAHHGGVVHRDIKPDNIFLTSSGAVKILDFGVAHLHGTPEEVVGEETADTTDTFTRPGGIVGTLNYMSPEQVRGRTVGPPSDIFSLGTVLYEMLTGRRPFEAESPADTMAAILNKDPEPVGEVNATVSPALEKLVARCLEKKVNYRFEAARDVAIALTDVTDVESSRPRLRRPSPRRRQAVRRRVLIGAVVVVAVAGAGIGHRELFGPPPPLPEDKHLAILPFEADGEDPDLRLLAVGLGESLSRDLRLLERQTYGDFWQVPLRRRRFENLVKIEDAFNDHGVSLVLNGRIARKDGNISLRLVLRDAPQSVVREIEIVEGFDNLVSFQRCQVEAVVSAMELEMSQETAAFLEDRWTTVVPSFVSYLRGVGLASFSSLVEDLEAAAGHLSEAVEADPVNGCARCAFGGVAARLAEQDRSGDWGQRGLDMIRPALDSGLAEAFLVEGLIRRALGHTDAAIAALENSADACPRDAEIQIRLARIYDSAGRLHDAEEAFQRAINLRPGYWEGHHQLGFLYYANGEYDEAANAWRAAVSCAPRAYGLYINLGMVLHTAGRLDEARRMYEKSFELQPEGNSLAATNLGTIYFEDARFAEAAEMFERSLEIDDSDYTVWGNLGHCYAVGADPSRAERPFRRAIDAALEELGTGGHDAQILARLAGYHATLGEVVEGRGYLRRTLEFEIRDPLIFANIGEAYEDLGDREAALEWIGRALRAEVSRSRFETRPSLRALVTDVRYQAMVEQPRGGESGTS